MSMVIYRNSAAQLCLVTGLVPFPFHPLDLQLNLF